MKNMNKDSALYKAILLGIVCTVCGLLLSLVNGLTAPIIERNALAAVEASLKEIYPDGTFKDVTDQYISQDETGLIDGIYEAEGKGYIFTLHNNGYGGEYKFMIGYNNDGTVSGYKGLEHLETPGKGSLAFEGDYVDQVMSLTSKDPMPIISGSTITTAGIGQAVNAAKAIFNGIQGIEYDPNAEPEMPEKPEAVALSEEDLSHRKASCTEEGDGVFACTALGFGGAANEAKVTVKDGKVTSFEIVTGKDNGDGVGDDAYDAANLERYVGADIDSKIDSVSGATETSESFRAMVQAALGGGNSEGGNASAEETQPMTIASEDLSKRKASCTDEGDGVLACTALGFGGAENKATVTVKDGKVVSFVPEKAGDYGDEVGDNAYSENELARYTDITGDSEVDGVSGATETSQAFRAMIQAALSGSTAEATAENTEATETATSGLSAEDLSDRKASCTADGNTYACTALGFGGAENKATITVEDGVVTAFVAEKAGDYGDEVGDQAYSDSNLERYVGAALDGEIDNVSGATETSKSFRAMVQEALNMANN